MSELTVPESIANPQDNLISKDSCEVEEHLIGLIFKYRTALNERKYLHIEERERDREHLNRLYSQLYTIHQKILDSKCYVQLGNIQKEQTIHFLADDTTPRQRLKMIAYILRSLTRPVVFIAGRYSLLLSHLEERKRATLLEDIPPSEEKSIAHPQTVSCLPVSAKFEEIQNIKKRIREWIQKHKTFSRWKKEANLLEAEVLSQMAASGEIEVSIPTDRQEWDGISTSIIIKES